ncbi:lytic murein transglycosylase B, partial [Pseudomonas sp. MWU13-2625]
LDAISRPAERVKLWKEYRPIFITDARIARGVDFWRQHEAVLARAEQEYGVPAQVIVSIIGVETFFGRNTGNYRVIEALSTLGFDYPPRAEVFRKELRDFLLLAREEQVDPLSLKGSYAGAMGLPQFMPSSFRAYAVDFDGDGRRDIWNSPADALASTAHYLQSSGWQQGQPWGLEVQLNSGFDYALADASTRKTVGEWMRLGMTPANGKALPYGSEHLSASLLLPAGYRGPAFLILDNFRAVLKYNNSSSYALAVNLLSERFGGAGQISGNWPKDDLPLSRSERIELQTLLSANSYDAGNPDGIIGANTRKAIRNAQQALGWPADGYPTHKLLESLRNR